MSNTLKELPLIFILHNQGQIDKKFSFGDKIIRILDKNISTRNNEIINRMVCHISDHCSVEVGQLSSLIAATGRSNLFEKLSAQASGLGVLSVALPTESRSLVCRQCDTLAVFGALLLRSIK
mmetsp:Transcript_27658/g.39263  ORF Transcript_27658/g.39263 Transcript_27658/m.39263 type:complete len:122 (-) Transcript_27658:1094-1459(-)